MEFIGESVEQALEKARQYFGSDELEYEVISEKRGLLRNEVVIKAWVVSPESVAEQLVTALLKAMGKSEEEQDGAIRFSLSPFLSMEDIDYTIEVLADEVREIRKLMRR